ncbi:hypothetical protein ACHAXS_001337 [Conticribra weissflogii]
MDIQSVDSKQYHDGSRNPPLTTFSDDRSIPIGPDPLTTLFQESGAINDNYAMISFPEEAEHALAIVPFHEENRGLHRSNTTTTHSITDMYSTCSNKREATDDCKITTTMPHSLQRLYTQRFSIRHDFDNDGFCIHHPHIQLFRLKPGGESWAVVRKKCPECILEDCPARMTGSVQNVVNKEPRYQSAPSTLSFASQNVFLPTLRITEEIEEEEMIRRLKRHLAARAYHFPGNTWCEDWMQYMSNTHTVLGLFFHHPLHPLQMKERIVILFGSIAIRLTISNMMWLYLNYNPIEVDVTKLMITSLTLGSFLHIGFDWALWHIEACTLCRCGRHIDNQIARWGRVIGLIVVMVTIAFGSYVVLLRALIEGYYYDASDDITLEKKENDSILLGNLISFVVDLFVVYPIAVTIIFSGMLGCGGYIPILGGRPREIRFSMRRSNL